MEAEVLGCVEDTVNEQGKPLHQSPGGAPELSRKPTQMGGAGPEKLHKHTVTGFLVPPLPTAWAVSRGHGGGGGSNKSSDLAAHRALSAKLGDDGPSAYGTFEPIRLRFAGGPAATPARATPTDLATPNPTAAGQPPLRCNTHRHRRASRACLWTHGTAHHSSGPAPCFKAEHQPFMWVAPSGSAFPPAPMELRRGR